MQNFRIPRKDVLDNYSVKDCVSPSSWYEVIWTELHVMHGCIFSLVRSLQLGGNYCTRWWRVCGRLECLTHIPNTYAIVKTAWYKQSAVCAEAHAVNCIRVSMEFLKQPTSGQVPQMYASVFSAWRQILTVRGDSEGKYRSLVIKKGCLIYNILKKKNPFLKRMGKSKTQPKMVWVLLLNSCSHWALRPVRYYLLNLP